MCGCCSWGEEGINPFSGCHAHLSAPETIKVLLGDGSPVFNEITIHLIVVGKDLECL